MAPVIGPGVVDDGFHEIVVIVQDVESAADRLCGVFGYQRLWSGPASAGATELLEVPPTPAREILIGDPAQGRGYLRLFDFPELITGVMRDGAQPWDTGGIFDINIRPLVPLERLHGAMTRVGFSAFAPMVAYDFVGMSVKQLVSRDADGLAIAVIERTHPPITGFEHVTGPASYVFNSTQCVPSRAQARALYADALGWTPAAESEWAYPETGRNVLGLPLDVARTRLLKVGIYHPRGVTEGSVEVLEVEGEALDFSAAAPPDRGLAVLRFPVSDVAAFLAAAERGGCRLIAPRTFRLEPYGQVLAGAAITPWGVRLEAYSLQAG